MDVHLSVGAGSEAVNAEVVTGSYFPTLGVQPAVGRLFTDADDLQPDSHPQIVLSYDYWQLRFGGDPAVVGRQVRMNNFPMTVVGVAEQGSHGMDWSASPAAWVPMMMRGRATVGNSQLENRRNRFLHVFARLNQDVNPRQAAARLGPWFKNYLRADTASEGWPAVTESQLDEHLASRLEILPGAQGVSRLLRQIEQPMLILVVATGLILLLACLNVANLSLARTLGRLRAIAVRSALGASRRRLLTEQFIESALFAAAGCFTGALLAPVVSRLLLSFLPRHGAAGVALKASLDLRVLLIALAITALVTLLSGTVPALYAASIRPVSALKQQSSSVTGGFGLRKAFVVGQFALALILLIGAGLFARTLGALRAQGPGYSTTNLLMFRVSPARDGYEGSEPIPMLARLLEEIQQLPDVDQAGIAAWSMMNGGGWNNPVTVESSERVVTDISLPMNAVSPGFFAALGAPTTRGRDFDARDALEEPGWNLRSAIVNEEFVQRYIPDGQAIGARLAFGARPDAVPSCRS